MGKLFKNYEGLLLIGAGAILWGTQGPFAQLLIQNGASSLLIAFGKLALGSLILICYLLSTTPIKLKIDKKGITYTAIIGFVSQAGFNYFYYSSVGVIGIANAAVILYTSPVIFLLISIFVFHEKMTWSKAFSSLLCVMGCAVAVTGGKLDVSGISISGVIMAFIATITFPIMSAICKKALWNYDSMTIIVYSFLWGSLFLMPIVISSGSFDITWNMKLLFGFWGIGLFPAVLAYILYFKGLGKGIQLSQAGVLSALEMVSAILIAWFIFHESYSVAKIAGVIMILGSIMISEFRRV